MRCELSPGENPRGSAPEAHPSNLLQSNLKRLVTPELRRKVLSCSGEGVTEQRGPGGCTSLRFNGRALCSAVDPAGEAEAWAASQELGDADLLVVLGLGLGHHIEALRRRTDVRIVALEPSAEVIRATLERRRLELPELRVVHSLQGLRDLLATDLRPDLKVCILAWPAHARLFPAATATMEQVVAKALRVAGITNITLKKRLPLWTQNLLLNLPRCVGKVPATALAGALQGKPLVLVSAGPSLDDNVEALARHQDRVAVLAVNTALGALERAGVRADYVVAVELLDVSCQLDDLVLNADCPRLLSVTANPALFQQARGPVLPFMDDQSFFIPFGHKAGLGQSIRAGGSVANTAFHLARMMGADPIVLVGQDLAYCEDRVYAAGTAFDQMKVSVAGGVSTLHGLEVKRRIDATVPGVDEAYTQLPSEPALAWGGEGHVWTTPQFNYFRFNFERWAKETPELTLINATEGGARIEGFAERRLEETLEQLPPLCAPKLPQRPRLEAAPLRAALEHELAAAKQVIVLARRAARLESPEVAQEMRDVLKQSGLTYACAWPALQDVAQRPGATLSDLCLQIANDTANTVSLLQKALS
jgi:6-hydroxymethylpterin diphosphokinase MptE-like